MDEHRALLFSIAYRMTGSVGDAEELVQEAFTRLAHARGDGTVIESPRAWLSAVTTRLAIDHLRSARVQRETYIGPWLPEPLLVDDTAGPAEHAELADSLSQAFLVVLETLSPVERAVFLLREVFDYDYSQIAEVVGKSEDNCRQIASRARRHVDARRPRFPDDPRRREALLDRFLAACESGDTEALQELLVADVVLEADGGGKTPAGRRPIVGRERVIRLLVTVARKRRKRGLVSSRRATINGVPGRLLVRADGTIEEALVVDHRPDGIAFVLIVRNPDKLRHLTMPA